MFGRSQDWKLSRVEEGYWWYPWETSFEIYLIGTCPNGASCTTRVSRHGLSSTSSRWGCCRTKASLESSDVLMLLFESGWISCVWRQLAREPAIGP
jgi:hypothetical protein